MPHTRAKDQSIMAFSAPKDLLKASKRRAVELSMTKSGYYRYCVAKELGFSEAEAREIAEHNAIRRLRQSVLGASGNGSK